MKQRIGLYGAPVLAIAILLFADLDPNNPPTTRMAAVAVLMAAWWITEAIPIPATALLPVALMPVLGILPGKEVAGLYFNHIIFLFIGGFIFALAMKRWNLHRRIALRIILILGTGPRRMLLGFMVATWFLSMWISNTATTMMMVPMAMAIILQLEENFGKEAIGRYPAGLLLGVAYSASIGGIATLIGTPPNLSFARILKITFPQAPEISFATWFGFAFPLSLIFLIIAWGLLGRLFSAPGRGFKTDPEMFRRQYRKLGRLGYEEGTILVLFGLLVFAWMFRRDIGIGGWVIPGWSGIFPTPGFIDDGTVAISIALLLFLIPTRTRSPGRSRLIDWQTASQINWGIVLLFGGGFALASGFKASGLSGYLGEQLTSLSEIPSVAMVGMICGTLTFLTELTSNTATTEMILPVLGSLAVGIGVNPLFLMVPATLSASCAFMLPVATPPNAIVFGTGQIRMGDMIRGGILLNLIGIILITAAIYGIGQFVLGIDLATVPAWATAP